MMQFTTIILDEYHGRGVVVVLEKQGGGLADDGQYCLKVHRRYYSENAAREAFAEATKPKRRRTKKEIK